MVELREIKICCAEVISLVHGSRGHDTNQLIEERVFFSLDLIETFLKLLAGIIVEAESHGTHQFGKVFDLFGFRLSVSSQNGSSREKFENLVGNRNIGEQHEFFDHVIGLKSMVKGDIGGVMSFLIESESDLSRSQS